MPPSQAKIVKAVRAHAWLAAQQQQPLSRPCHVALSAVKKSIDRIECSMRQTVSFFSWSLEMQPQSEKQTTCVWVCVPEKHQPQCSSFAIWNLFKLASAGTKRFTAKVSEVSFYSNRRPSYLGWIWQAVAFTWARRRKSAEFGGRQAFTLEHHHNHNHHHIRLLGPWLWSLLSLDIIHFHAQARH